MRAARLKSTRQERNIMTPYPRSIRSGIRVAAGRPCARDFGTHARPGVGTCHLLCRRDNSELEILLYRAGRICNRSYAVLDCGGGALSADRLNLDCEGTGPILGDRQPIRR